VGIYSLECADEPSFIFNTLNNVQWLVNNDDKLTANNYLRIFSDFVLQNMNNISKELIPLSSEIELVKNYLKLEKLRLPGNSDNQQIASRNAPEHRISQQHFEREAYYGQHSERDEQFGIMLIRGNVHLGLF
jgi:hypothetical protein